MKWQLVQVGIVIKDMEKSIAFYSSHLGLGPFRMLNLKDLSVEVRGKLIERGSHKGE
jgi:catechol 2,3-dioxygenase-like lactoylglutathione lyase family enzyme